mmetsp:Transcript_7078/g.12715  ORF Transcript_7078/g.12715 Transcript_7078/m.12715 type:complete len:362 (-) Transcript_7078:172-1257(-)
MHTLFVFSIGIQNDSRLNQKSVKCCAVHVSKTYVSSRRCISNVSMNAQQESGSVLEQTLIHKFGQHNISRVLDSYNRIQRGDIYINTPDNNNDHRQEAHSFIESLTALPFHDISNESIPGYNWTRQLESHWTTIRDELQRAYSTSGRISKTGNNVWVPAVRDEALDYGPNWRTLVLQDREWDPVNAKLFPKTVKILKHTVQCPSVEVFFAKQAPNTGIKSHSDGCNFILTAHLALDVPENECWIEVGGIRKHWKNGKMLVFDTSFMHSTMNESMSEDRYVLLIRFWHPELKKVEIDALQFIFNVLDNPELLDQHVETMKREKESKQAMQSLDNETPNRSARRAAKRSKGTTRSNPMGFGAK